ncbi:hypothetical protein ACFYPC_09175 [Streptomyces sp. NPDC005808]|uniref:hypothetical protein n=1 Tax=Streptomyces sp. NPDC005808 TaxID=3364734 RepID=UPI0036B4F3B9
MSGETAPARDVPAREVPAGEKYPLGEDTSARRTDPVRPVAGPGTGSREGADALDRETGESASRDSRGATATGGAHARPTAHETRQLPDQDHDRDIRLLPQDECDKFELRLRHAVGGFVDGPRDSVAEADQVLEELAARLSDAVTRRRSTLRTSWQQKTGEKKADEKTGNGADTEQLRITLRDYREVTERLLRF